MSSLEEQLHMMQQQITALQEQLHNAPLTPMQSADGTATNLPLHSLWALEPITTGLFQKVKTELLGLDTPLHTTAPLSDSEGKNIIECYSPIAHLDYKAPATIPSAEKMMNRGQRMEDNSLKQLQYSLSAAYHPLDIPCHEIVSLE
ncbi:hypothetical protein [Parasitella parasitica]|uniref:Uncharacterized protein n=1 Tax=Parasitella parasitica TaxID=35722 RepID=A0A0B7N6Q1_9FUNG|nr:hypothetical protein [Parasitella parasitica]